jgi:hypothetical protein
VEFYHILSFLGPQERLRENSLSWHVSLKLVLFFFVLRFMEVSNPSIYPAIKLIGDFLRTHSSYVYYLAKSWMMVSAFGIIG